MKIKLIQSLTPIQWWWIFVAYWRLWIIWLSIKLRQGDWLKQKVFVQKQPTGATPTLLDPRWLAMHESVRLAARLHFVAMACLPRSIVLADMLNKRGESAVVKIGVGKADGQFASHAWVEVSGCIVGEPEHMSSQFAAIKWTR